MEESRTKIWEKMTKVQICFALYYGHTVLLFKTLGNILKVIKGEETRRREESSFKAGEERKSSDKACHICGNVDHFFRSSNRRRLAAADAAEVSASGDRSHRITLTAPSGS